MSLITRLVALPRVHGATRLFWDENTKVEYDAVDSSATNRIVLTGSRLLHS